MDDVIFRKITDKERYFPARGRSGAVETIVSKLVGARPGETLAAEIPNGTTERAFKRAVTMAVKELGHRVAYSKYSPDGVVVFELRDR